MSYRIVRKKIEGDIMYAIIDSDGEQISEWDDMDDARQELFDLNENVDVVDFFAASTPGLADERTNDEVLDETT
jgi:hypothetical protein